MKFTPNHSQATHRKSKLVLRRHAALAALASMIAVPAVHGTTGTWVTDANSAWGAAANWTGGTIPGGSIDDIANFTANLTAGRTITMDGSRTLGSMVVGDPTSGFFAYTLSANGQGGQLVFDVTTGNANLTFSPAANTVQNVINASVVLNDSLTVHSLNTFVDGNVFNGNISGTGGLTLTADGTHPAGTASVVGALTLNGINTYSGGTTVQEGSIRVNNPFALGTGPVTINSTGQLWFAASGIYTSNITVNGLGWNIPNHGPYGALRSDGAASNFTGSITLGSDSRFQGSAAGNTRISGVIGESVAGTNLEINELRSGAASSASTWVFENTNTYTGKTTVNAGTLRIGSGGTTGSLGSTSALEFANATIEFRRSDNVTVVTPFTQLTGTIGGIAVTGTNFVQSGTGVLTIDNVGSAYTGTTTVNGTNGKLVFGTGGAYAFAGTGLITLANGADLEFNTSSAVNLGNVTGAANSYVIQSGSGTTTLGGALDNVQTWATVNNGTLVLDKVSTSAIHAINANNNLGLVINGGTARLGAGGDQIFAEVDVQVNGGVLDLNGSNEGFDVLSGSGGTVTNNAANSASTLTLGENNSGINALSAIAYDRTFAGAITDGSGANAGTLAVTKTGTGLQILGGANTYSGATTINGGTLAINGSILASGTVNVNNSGTLSGTGSIGNILLATGGSIRPGATNADTAVGTLTGSSLTVTGGDLRLNLGTTSDLIALDGPANFTAPSTVTPTFSAPVVSGTTYQLITATAGVTLTAVPTLSGVPANTRSTFTITNAPNSLDLTVGGASAKSLIWTGATTAVWDVNSTANFDGGGSEKFFNLDAVSFGDQAYNRLVTFVAGVVPTTVTVNNSAGNDYVFAGAGFGGAGASLTKTGNGALALNQANTFGGPVRITGGTVKAGNGSALGDNVGQTFVSSGATLDVNGQNLGAEVINIIGTGVGGTGALVNTGAGQNNATRFITLTGNATIGGVNRFDIRSNGGGEILDLGGFTLTKIGTNTFGVVGATLVTPGNIQVDQGDFQIETGATVMGSGTLTWAPGTRATFYQSSAALVTRQMIWNGTTVDTIGQNSSVGSNITLGGDATFVATANTLTLTGRISESGGVRSLIKNNGGTLTLTGNNTFTGGITSTGGTINLNGTNTVAGPVSITNGVLNVNSTAQTRASLGNASSIALSASTLTLNLANSYTLPVTTLSSTNSSTINFTGQTQATTLSINSALGSSTDFNALNIQQGTVALQSGADVTVASMSLGTTALTTGNVGTLNVLPGASLTTKSLLMGEGGGNTGMLNQSGGVVTVTGTDLNEGVLRIGHFNGTGATYNLSGGTLNVLNSTTSIGIDGSNATLNISGGTANLHRLMVDGRSATGPIGGTLNLSAGELVIGSGGLGNSGNGQVNITGGKLSAAANTTFSSGMNFGNNAATLDTRGNIVALSGVLYGPGGFTKVGNGRLVISGANSNIAGTVNLNAGETVLSGSLISAGTIVNVGSGSRLTLDGSGTNPAFVNGTVNVNGGLLVGGGNGSTTGKAGTLNVVGGEVRPGLSIGTLSAGEMTLTDTKAQFELNGSSTTAGGTTNDLIAVSGALNIATTTVLPSFTSTPVSGNVYTLFTAGSLTGLPSVDPTSTTSRLTYNVGMSGTSVTLSVTGTAKSLIWTGANGNAWNVNAAQNWSEPAAETFYQADSVTFDGASAGDVSLAGSLQPVTTTVNSAADYSFIGTGSIDAGSLVKAGVGTLRVLTTNSYTGGTTITAGTLAFGNGALGNGAITMNGGTLQWNGSNTQDVSSRIAMVPLTIAKLDTNGNTVLLAHPLGNGTTGGLTKAGAGTLVLLANSTYTGATRVEAGTLQVGNDELTGSVGAGTGNVTIDAGATLSFYRRGLGIAINNPISGGGTLELKGDGSALNADYSLGGNNSTFNGNVVVDRARLVLDNANDLGTASVLVKSAGGLLITGGTFANSITTTGNGWLENGTVGAIRFSNATGALTGPVTLAGDTRITANAAADAGTISGVISGPGALNKTGAGIITLSGNSANTYTGGTTVLNAGGSTFSPLVLAKTSGNAIPGDLSIGNGTAGYASVNLGASEQIADSAVINFNGSSGNWAYFKLLGFNETVAGLSSPLVAGAPVLGGVIENMEAEVVAANSLLTVNGTGNYAYNGYIRDRASGAGAGTIALTKAGAGTQTLIGPNVTYTGTTNVSGGVLKLENTTGFNSVNIVNDAAVEISAPVGSNYTLGSGRTWSGGGDWIKTGEGRVRLANGIVNATGNIFVQAGTLGNDSNAANWAGSSANLSVAAGATFDMRADSVRLNALNGAGLVTNSYGVGNNVPDVLTVGVANGNGVFTGRLTDGGTGVAEGRGGIALTKEGTGSQTLTGTNTYAGATTITGGTLRVGDGGTTGTLGTNTITNNGTLIFNRSNTHTVNNVINGSGLLVKEGAGTMVLNGSSTYTGATTIAAGTLQLGAGTTLPVAAGIWLDATDGTTVNTAAGGVTSWTNKGTLGSVGNAIAAAGQEPTFVEVEGAMNNQPVIRFDAANGGGGPFDRLTTPIDLSASNSTVIYAGRLGGGANFRLLSGAANNWLLGAHGGLSDRAHLGATGAFVDLGGVTANTSAHIYTSTNAIGGTAAFYSDTLLKGATTNANLVGPNGLSLGGGFSNAGAAPTGEFSDGDIGELLVFNSVLSEDDRRAVEAYLSRKWKGVGSTNVLPTNTAVSLTTAGAALDVNGVTQTVGSIAGVTGTAIALGGGSITTGGSDASTTFDGVISGNGAIHKVGAGTWTLGGVNSTNGNVFVDSGTLELNGSLSGATTTVNGGMLKGGGTIGALNLSSGTIASGTGLGILNTGDLSLGGGTLAFEINGTTAGTAYDQLNVAGSVALTGLVSLTIDLGLFDPADNGSQSFTIISNNLSDGIDFDFANNRAFTYDSIKLGEGDQLFVGNQEFTISYAGGTNNNDVVLTAVPEPGTATSLLGGLAILLGMQRRRRKA